jgi:hypothetical protein
VDDLQPISDALAASSTTMVARLEGEVMVFRPMLVKEVSLGGALVETAFPLHLNSLHDLRLELGARSVVLKGRVVHSQVTSVDDETLYRTGIEFVEPTGHATAAIAEFLESLTRNGH